jgi:hypothetical protein
MTPSAAAGPGCLQLGHEVEAAAVREAHVEEDDVDGVSR